MNRQGKAAKVTSAAEPISHSKFCGSGVGCRRSSANVGKCCRWGYKTQNL